MVANRAPTSQGCKTMSHIAPFNRCAAHLFHTRPGGRPLEFFSVFTVVSHKRRRLVSHKLEPRSTANPGVHSVGISRPSDDEKLSAVAVQRRPPPIRIARIASPEVAGGVPPLDSGLTAADRPRHAVINIRDESEQSRATALRIPFDLDDRRRREAMKATMRGNSRLARLRLRHADAPHNAKVATPAAGPSEPAAARPQRTTAARVIVIGDRNQLAEPDHRRRPVATVIATATMTNGHQVDPAGKPSAVFVG